VTAGEDLQRVGPAFVVVVRGERVVQRREVLIRIEHAEIGKGGHQ
jgi:hypothetical protein